MNTKHPVVLTPEIHCARAALLAAAGATSLADRELELAAVAIGDADIAARIDPERRRRRSERI